MTVTEDGREEERGKEGGGVHKADWKILLIKALTRPSPTQPHP